MEVACFCTVVLFLTSYVARAMDTCSGPHSTKLKISVASRRNLTGHWMVTADLYNSNREGVWRRPREVILDVEHGAAFSAGADTVQLGARATMSGAVPPPDYELFPELGYYKFHVAASDWETARETCAREGAHLLVLNSDAEVVVVKEFFGRKLKLQNASYEVYVFVGIHDRYTEGKWMTMSGQSVADSGYPHWHSGQPSGGTAENCGVVVQSNNLFADAPCSWKLAFICEYISH